jgi:hypothetical protein
MRKYLPALWGFLAGCGVGLYMVCCVKSEEVPWFIGAPVGWLGSLFARGASEASVLVLALLGIILWCGVLGAVLGFLAGLVVHMTKARLNGSP